MYTTINTIANGEQSLLQLINNVYPNFIRLDDSLDQNFTGKTGEFIIAFEDHIDFDYNDWIGRAILNNGVLIDLQAIGSWSSVQQNIAYNNGIFSDQTIYGTRYSLQSLNTGAVDRMVTWQKQVNLSQVPEPSTLALVGAVVGGLIFRKLFRS